ncbi:MAG: GTP 3',8-cyclase MoaA [Alphaproteobacteria bacterium]
MADGGNTVPPLVDPFGRAVTYLRLSVTDRCDFRCSYCMAEQMTFLPKADLLTLEELDRLASAFIRLGVRKLRITGGEPLVRRDVKILFQRLSRHLEVNHLDELTLTTNASQLARHAAWLAGAGVRRINVSLDTLDSARFAELTRRGALAPVLEGIRAAQANDMRIKINAVALKGLTDQGEAEGLIDWCGAEGHDLTFIEIMPMGDLPGHSRLDQYLPLVDLKSQLEQRYTLIPRPDKRTGGPARYFDCVESGGQIGFISPLTGRFCEGCNRVRLTCTGRLYPCLGRETYTDFRTLMREGADDAALEQALRLAIADKPEGHDFRIDDTSSAPAVPRHMSTTGG